MGGEPQDAAEEGGGRTRYLQSSGDRNLRYRLTLTGIIIAHNTPTMGAQAVTCVPYRQVLPHIILLGYY